MLVILQILKTAVQIPGSKLPILFALLPTFNTAASGVRVRRGTSLHHRLFMFPVQTRRNTERQGNTQAFQRFMLLAQKT